MDADLVPAGGDLSEIFTRCQALVTHYARRDRETHVVRAVRRGDFEAIAPGAFTEDFPAPIIANQIDTMARDMAATLAPLPSFNCPPSSVLNDRAKEAAEKRTKIAQHYVECSQLQAQMPDGVDSFHGYGMFVGQVRPDFRYKGPKIKLVDGGFAYPVWDEDLRTKEILVVSYMSEYQLKAIYPEAVRQMRGDRVGPPLARIKVHTYENHERTVVYLPDAKCYILENTINRLGRCSFVAVPRPMGEDWHTVPRGAYADLVWPQLAANEFRMLGLEAVDKAVRAPIIVPTDVADVPFGPDAVLSTNNPQGVGRLKIDVPQSAFQATELLEQDIREGGMSPGSRSGNVNASVITGRGIDALGEGYSQQVMLAQSRIGFGLKQLIEICFEMDELYWPNEVKEVRGQSLESPGRMTYVPSRHIKGDYSVEVDYGFLLGLDANRALVFILQAHAAGLISTDTAMRNLPVKINLGEEVARRQLEQLRESLLQSVAATSQAIPEMIVNGQAPSQILAQLAGLIEGVKEGKPIEEVVAKVFAPPPPAPPTQALAGPGEQTVPEGMAAALGQEQQAVNPITGQPDANGRPSLQGLIAGLTGAGRPNLQASVMRQNPVA